MSRKKTELPAPDFHVGYDETVVPAERLPVLFKVVDARGHSFHAAPYEWTLPDGETPGGWHETMEQQLIMCRYGLHLTDLAHLDRWYVTGSRVFLAETDPSRPALRSGDGLKFLADRVRLVKEIPIDLLTNADKMTARRMILTSIDQQVRREFARDLKDTKPARRRRLMAHPLAQGLRKADVSAIVGMNRGRLDVLRWEAQLATSRYQLLRAKQRGKSVSTAEYERLAALAKASYEADEYLQRVTKLWDKVGGIPYLYMQLSYNHPTGDYDRIKVEGRNMDPAVARAAGKRANQLLRESAMKNLETARQRLARFIGVDPSRFVFSG